MSTTTRPITADEFFMVPDNHMRNELIRGEVKTHEPHVWRRVQGGE